MDIEGNAVTVEAAHKIYGVIVDPDTLEVNQDATSKLRTETRATRLTGYSGTPIRCNGEIVMHVTENLDLRRDTGDEVYCCAKCQTEVGPLGSNYKEHCIRVDEPVSKSNLLIGEPSRFIDDTPEFRQFFCPGCGTLIENEIAMCGEPVLMDIHIEK